MRHNFVSFDKKEQGVQAGLWLARRGTFVNSPDVAQTTLQTNSGTAGFVTYSTEKRTLVSGTIVGMTMGNTAGIVAEWQQYVTDLGSSKYRLRHPLKVAFRQINKHEWVAAFDEAEIMRSGDSPGEALAWLLDSIAAVYELYKKKGGQLGALPLRQFRALGRYIVEKSNPAT